MVLYLDALKSNCLDYVNLANLARRFIVRGSDLDVEIGQAIITAERNMEVLDILLDAGMREITVKALPDV